MAKIRIDLNEPFLDGMDIKFKAPCDCTAIDGMKVYYPLDDDSGTGSQSFVFKDAHGNTLTGLGNLFSAGALVKVMVDRTTESAYIQNADTNKYLEDKIANAGTKVTLSSSVSSTSTTTAANSYAVKKAYDLAAAKPSVSNTEITSISSSGGLISNVDPLIRICQIGNMVIVDGSIGFQNTSDASSALISFGYNFPASEDGTSRCFAAVGTQEDQTMFDIYMEPNGSSSGKTNMDMYILPRDTFIEAGTHLVYFSFSYIAAS